MINSVTKNENSINAYEVKKNYQFSLKCEICQELIHFGIEKQILEKIQRFPYPHIILHGVPIHAIIVYIDNLFQVRGKEFVESIEIKRDSNTFNQILRKWSNPF